MKLDKIVDKLSTKLCDQINDKPTMDKLNVKIFKPIINNIFLQMYPYIILVSIIVLSFFVLLLLILWVNIRGIYK